MSRLESEQGIALPFALGIMLALTIAVTTVIQFASANSRTAGYNVSDQNSRSIAEDGFNRAASVIAANPASLGPIHGSAGDYPQGGSVSWTGTRGITDWTVTATSVVPNPTGPDGAPLTHTIRAELELAPDPGAWNYVWVRPSPGNCMLIKDSFVMEAPLYVEGDLCVDNDARYGGPHLSVAGTIQTQNAGSVGTAQSPVPHVSVGAGCRYGTSAMFTLPCTSEHRVWASEFDTTMPDVDKPPVDFAARYADAAPGSTTRGHSCTSPLLLAVNSKLTATTMDDNTVRDSSLGVFNLTPSVAYDCIQRAADGTVLGRLQWSGTTIDPATLAPTGTLTVTGTIFLDGDLSTSIGTHGVVNGEGVIYANNKIVLEDSSWLCGVPDCGSSWSPNMDPPHLLFLFAGYPGHPAIVLKSDAKFQGGLNAVGGIKVSNNAYVNGPAIAETLEAENGASFDTFAPLLELPDGVVSGKPPVLRVKDGSWRG